MTGKTSTVILNAAKHPVILNEVKNLIMEVKNLYEKLPEIPFPQ